MKQTRLNIVTKTEKYPIIIGSNLTLSLLKIFKLNSIYFDKCLIFVDKSVPKKFVSNIKRSLKNKKISAKGKGNDHVAIDAGQYQHLH